MSPKPVSSPNDERVEHHFYLSIKELSYSLGVSHVLVESIIAEGIIVPVDEHASEKRFDEQAIRRLKTSLRLHHDLGVNFAGIALALDLLEELDDLRRQLECGVGR
jgi:chaperone modulatory protein CbpM